jgi:hypothetical protein
MCSGTEYKSNDNGRHFDGDDPTQKIVSVRGVPGMDIHTIPVYLKARSKGLWWHRRRLILYAKTRRNIKDGTKRKPRG